MFSTRCLSSWRPAVCPSEPTGGGVQFPGPGSSEERVGVRRQVWAWLRGGCLIARARVVHGPGVRAEGGGWEPLFVHEIRAGLLMPSEPDRQGVGNLG